MPKSFRWLQGKCHVYCHSHTHPNLMSSMELVLRLSLCPHYDLSLPSTGFFPSRLNRPSVLRFILSSLPPSLKPSICPFLLSWSLCTQSQRSPLCGLTTQRLAANDLAWPQRLGSALSLSHGIYTQTNKQMGAPQRHVHASRTATYARGCTVCQYTPTRADTHSFS